MLPGRHPDRQTSHNTPLPYWGRVAKLSTCCGSIILPPLLLSVQWLPVASVGPRADPSLLPVSPVMQQCIKNKHCSLGLHRISYPAPAEIQPNFHIRRSYPASPGRQSRSRKMFEPAEPSRKNFDVIIFNCIFSQLLMDFYGTYMN